MHLYYHVFYYICIAADKQDVGFAALPILMNIYNINFAGFCDFFYDEYLKKKFVSYAYNLHVCIVLTF